MRFVGVDGKVYTVVKHEGTCYAVPRDGTVREVLKVTQSGDLTEFYHVVGDEVDADLQRRIRT